MTDKEKEKKNAIEGLPPLLVEGKIKLAKPLLASDREVTELSYDFSRITVRQYMDALDTDKTGDNFRVSPKQALALFRKATVGLNEGIDEHDLRERLGQIDTIAGIKLGTYFFISAGRLGELRLDKRSSSSEG